MSLENDPTQPVIVVDPPWVAYARSKIGTHEVAGAGDNPFVVECLKMAGLPADLQHDDTAWCGAFAGRCMREAGITPPKGYAAARHWLEWGQPLAVPVLGCVAVFARPPSPSSGHVAFVMAISNGPTPLLQMLGGNQGNAVRIAPYPRTRLLGYRWPVGFPLSSRSL